MMADHVLNKMEYATQNLFYQKCYNSEDIVNRAILYNINFYVLIES